MNEIQEFNFQGNSLRALLIDNEPFFVGKDAAKAIGYKNYRDAINNHVKGKYKRMSQITTTSGTQTMIVISEPGLYQLASQSKLPSAEPFQDWAYEEVLPSIRKHGTYMTPETLQKTLAEPENMIHILTALKNEQDAHKRLKAENSKMKPHAILGAVVENSVNSISVKALATLLKAKGVNIGQNRLFQWLRENGYLISRYGRSRNYPTQRAMDMELFELKPSPIVHNSGEMETRYTPLVTGKGQKYFVNKFFNEKVLEV